MPDTVLNRGATTLTEWFKANQNDTTAQRFLYHEFPSHYVWVGKKWQARKSSRKGPPVGRLYLTHPGKNYLSTIVFPIKEFHLMVLARKFDVVLMDMFKMYLNVI
jgi:hypothetical protein